MGIDLKSKGVHLEIAEKILATPVENIALCLARIAMIWMCDPRDQSKLTTSKPLGSDEIAAVTEALDEAGLWPKEDADSGQTSLELEV